MAQKKIVHVVGTGTIGEPLIGILCTFKEQFGVDEVTFHKRTPLLTDRSKVMVLCNRGAKLCVDKERRQKFVEMGMTPTYETEEAIERAKAQGAKRETAGGGVDHGRLMASGDGAALRNDKQPGTTGAEGSVWAPL